MNANSIISGVLLLFVIITGIWIKRQGKPYNIMLFTIHKLATLAVIVLVLLALRTIYNETGLTVSQWAITIGTGVIILATMISGGVISAKEQEIKSLQIAHKILPVLTLIGIIYIFLF